MVNTFLPYPDYEKSAKALDVKRLGKQRVEAMQILRANLGLTNGWKNHPAAVMWKGHEGQLLLYTVAICMRWRALGYKDTVLDKVMSLFYDIPREAFKKPWWLGHRKFHKSHQSNLRRKDANHYKFNVPDDLPYLWPKGDGTIAPLEEKKGTTRASKSNS